MEAKKQGAGEEELSMEEILQSIRRIIADDGEEEKSVAYNLSENNGSGGDFGGASNILELTEMVEDDGSVTSLKEPSKEPAGAVDVLNNIDAALTQEAPPAPKEIKPEQIFPEPASPPPAISVPEPEITDTELNALLSKTAEEAAVSSLSKLKPPETKSTYQSHPSPTFRSGNTVEDMVEDLLRPMMKDWLDSNLPDIVERIVEREVLRLTRR